MFDSEKPTEAITSVKNIPSDFSIMKKYFSNISVKPNGGHSWFQVWLGQNESPENLLTNLKHWSTSSNTSMYKKRLQHKYTSKDYWLLWSTERMDTEALHNEVTTIIKRHTNQMFNFSFNFTFIRKDNKFTNEIKDSSKWNKALVIEVKKEEKDSIYPILGKIFSTSNNLKILGTDMRMIPMTNSDLPSHTKMKISHLIAKQEQFLSTLIVKPCLFLNEIDYYNIKLETSMRDIVMDLETLKTFNTKGQPMKIFQNVDFSSWHNCYVVTFPKHLEKEADDYISQLPAYLHYLYGDEVLLMLSAEGAAQAHRSKWDPETLCATSNIDLELDAITNESSDKGWLPELKLEILDFDTTNLEWQTQLHTRATDADSISTFASKKVGHQNKDQENEMQLTSDTTPKKEKPINQNFESNDTTNIISPTTKEDGRNSKIKDLQTRESGSHEESKTPRIAASDLGAPL